MPKSTQTQHGQSSDLDQGLGTQQNRETHETEKGKEGEGLERKKRESKVHRLSQGKGFYTPKKAERKKPVLLTVDQYLKKAGHDRGISDLVKSMYKRDILTFEAWASKVKALLKKRT